MTDIPEGFVEYRPATTGKAPPFWRTGMLAYMDGSGPLPGFCFDNRNSMYWVPREAVHGPDDVVPLPIRDALHILRQYPADELAKHGVTLEPEKDWAESVAEAMRQLHEYDQRREAIEYLRTHCRPIGDA